MPLRTSRAGFLRASPPSAGGRHRPGCASIRARSSAGGRGPGAKRGPWADAYPVAPWDWRSVGAIAVQAGGVVGNRSGLVYHSAKCRSVSRMAAKNLVIFGGAAEAEAAGYRKAGDCR